MRHAVRATRTNKRKLPSGAGPVTSKGSAARCIRRTPHTSRRLSLHPPPTWKTTLARSSLVRRQPGLVLLFERPGDFLVGGRSLPSLRRSAAALLLHGLLLGVIGWGFS